MIRLTIMAAAFRASPIRETAFASPTLILKVAVLAGDAVPAQSSKYASVSQSYSDGRLSKMLLFIDDNLLQGLDCKLFELST